jgi:hypothetical protein
MSIISQAEFPDNLYLFSEGVDASFAYHDPDKRFEAGEKTTIVGTDFNGSLAVSWGSKKIVVPRDWVHANNPGVLDETIAQTHRTFISP